MLDILLATSACVSLAGLGVKLALAGWREAELARAARRSAESERELLAARVAEIAERRTREREQAERTWDGFRKFVVARKVLEARDIRSFQLEPLDRRPLPSFHPGQYLTFRLHVPGQPRPVTRCYSLSDAPRTGHFRVTIKRVAAAQSEVDRAQGVASCHLHDDIEVGDVVEARAPAGAFWLDPAAATPVVLIGGGIGVTPLISMLNAITEAGSSRTVWFLYGVRDSADHVMADHLRSLANRHPSLSIHVCYSQPEPGAMPGAGFQHAGRIDMDLIRRVVVDLSIPHFYLCGPSSMMQSLTAGLAAAGVGAARIHHEAFGPASVKGTSGSAARTEVPNGVEVHFLRSKRRLPWDGSATILDLAEREGIAIESGCRAGNCGSCAAVVRSGQFAYPVAPGAEVPAGSCLTCVATPLSALELDA